MIYSEAPAPYFQFANLNRFSEHILHFISTRNYRKHRGFTIGMNEYFDEASVRANREFLANQFGFSPDAFVFCEQVHENRVVAVTPLMRGRGAFSRSNALPSTDATITNHPDICLVAQAADCVPILFYDPIKKAIGCAHAGWRGTVSKIAGEVVKTFVANYGSRPGDIVVGIGPSIGPCCFEVGAEVVEQVRDAFGNANGLLNRNPQFNGPMLNLWRANVLALTEQGVNPKHIEVANRCTKCNNSQFFSARAGDLGRMGAFILLKP